MIRAASSPDQPIPDLRIIPTGMLLHHELHDEQRATPLIRHLKRDKFLKNPPIVVEAGSRDNRFVILDGANRVVALDVLGIGHVLVQVVPYSEPHVRLETWYHTISGIPTEAWIERLKRISGLESRVTSIFHARALLAARTILGYYITPDGTVSTLVGGGLDLHERTRLLQEIVDTYINEARLNRTNTDNIEQLLTLYPGMSSTIVFPKYDPVEVIDLAQSGLKVPPGITRHIIDGRALRVNYPLEYLTTDISLEEKNRMLEAWVLKRFEERKVRFYAEATYLFDE